MRSDSRAEAEDLARKAAADVDERRLVELTRELVRIRSVFEPDSGATEAEAALYVADVLERMGFEVTVEDAAPGRPNVIADWHGSGFTSGRPTLMFEGHTDVVTEGDLAAWSYPPFAAQLHDGRIYGRGACDMKGGVAAAIMAAAAVMRQAPELAGRIRLGIVADEEGMMSGIKHFIERGWADEVSAAIVCEPEQNELCLHQKGAMRIRAMVRGVMAHGAMPYAGINPIRHLSDFIQALGSIEKDEQRRLGEHEYLGLPWITPTIVRAPVAGEAQFNVMPDAAMLALDVRTVPGQEHSALLLRLQQAASALAAADEKLSIDLELIEERPWTETPRDAGLVTALAAAHRLVLSREPRYGGVPGATDGTFLHAWAQVPIVTVGPGQRTVPHQADEYLDIAELIDAARLYAAAAVLFLSRD